MRARYIEGDELDRLAARVGAADWVPCRLMLETGVRVGDAVKARRGDFFRDEAGRPCFRWTAEKTGKAGICKISEHLFGLLADPGRDSGEFVFPGSGKGGHLTRQAVWARVKKAARVSGDACGVSPHALRKVAAVRLRRTEGFRSVKAALQHSRDATAAIYAYADAMGAPDTPLTWGDVDLLAEFVAAKVRDMLDKGRPAVL